MLQLPCAVTTAVIMCADRNTVFKKLRQQSDFESLFWDDEFSHPLRLLFQNASSMRLKMSIVEKHIEMLTVTQERENELFWQEAAASNLLAFLYLFIYKYQEALKQLNLTLEHAPNNLNAIVGTIRILEKQQLRNSEAQKKVDQYKRLTENSEEMEQQILICRGEIAYACSFISSDFYMQAVDRYEALLRVDSKDELSGYMIRWKYHLAYTYNRMLNKGHREKLVQKLGTKDIVEVFNKISELYDAVIRSNDEFYKGKAMIDVVDTYKKCETFGNCENVQLIFPYACSPDEYVKRATDTAPLDPHVLERCGRHYRQRASNKKNFEEAVEIFDQLLELHPSRHVAWHHKGLACRALWHIVGKYDDVAKLYNNSARKGNKRGVRMQRRIYGQSPRVDGALAAHCHQTDDSVPVLTGQEASHRDTPDDEQVTVAQDIPSNSRGAPHNAPRALPTLPAKNRRGIGDLPRQPKKPDLFDRLRTSNPAAKDNTSRQFLEQAKECFERAKGITKGTCSPYIVDLARSLISLGKNDAAETEFETASIKLARTMNDNDATYLYEQWALLRHDRHDLAKQHTTADEARLKDVASLYRQAILYAVRAREKSRIAFYKLRDLLHDELQLDDTNAAAKMEYRVLYDSVEKYGESKEMLVTALKNEEETRVTAWQLITLLRARRQRHDASAAFMYLTALHEANQLDLDDDSPAPDTELSNKQLLIDVVYQLVRRRRHHRDDHSGDDSGTVVDDQDSGQTFGEVFRWMVGKRRISKFITVAPADGPRPFADSGEICVLAPSNNTPGVSGVVRVLRDVCSITVVKAFCEGESHIPWGGPLSEGLRSVVAISQSVAVVVDGTDTLKWRRLCPVMDELMEAADVKMCLVADDELPDYSNIEQRYE